jgi:hypothetical protein
VPFRRPLRGIVAASVLVTVLIGCADSKPPPELHPLTGTVTRDGQPVTAGGLIFIPDPADGSGRVVNATVKADGTFEAHTEHTGANGSPVGKPGAPAGRYKVVYHPPGDGQKSGLDVEFPERVSVEPGAKPVTLALPLPAPKDN